MPCGRLAPPPSRALSHPSRLRRDTAQWRQRAAEQLAPDHELPAGQPFPRKRGPRAGHAGLKNALGRSSIPFPRPGADAPLPAPHGGGLAGKGQQTCRPSIPLCRRCARRPGRPHTYPTNFPPSFPILSTRTTFPQSSASLSTLAHRTSYHRRRPPIVRHTTHRDRQHSLNDPWSPSIHPTHPSLPLAWRGRHLMGMPSPYLKEEGERPAARAPCPSCLSVARQINKSARHGRRVGLP